MYTMQQTNTYHPLEWLPLPQVIVSQINAFLGGNQYWKARHQLTMYNARLKLFQSDWWRSWHTYLCWYHWYLRNPHCKHHSLRNSDRLLTVDEMPKYCSWIVGVDTRVLLLLRLFKLSIQNPKLLNTVSLQLRIHLEYWEQLVKAYRKTVYG